MLKSLGGRQNNNHHHNLQKQQQQHFHHHHYRHRRSIFLLVGLRYSECVIRRIKKKYQKYIKNRKRAGKLHTYEKEAI